MKFVRKQELLHLNSCHRYEAAQNYVCRTEHCERIPAALFTSVTLSKNKKYCGPNALYRFSIMLFWRSEKMSSSLRPRLQGLALFLEIFGAVRLHIWMSFLKGFKLSTLLCNTLNDRAGSHVNLEPAKKQKCNVMP